MSGPPLPKPGPEDFESIWNGRDALAVALERDYVACRGDGWDLIWETPSPYTTPWEALICRLAGWDPNEFMPSSHSAYAKRDWLTDYAASRDVRNQVARDDYLLTQHLRLAKKAFRHKSRRGSWS
jgi:hypothetical protein